MINIAFILQLLYTAKYLAIDILEIHHYFNKPVLLFDKPLSLVNKHIALVEVMHYLDASKAQEFLTYQPMTIELFQEAVIAAYYNPSYILHLALTTGQPDLAIAKKIHIEISNKILNLFLCHLQSLENYTINLAEIEINENTVNALINQEIKLSNKPFTKLLNKDKIDIVNFLAEPIDNIRKNAVEIAQKADYSLVCYKNATEIYVSFNHNYLEECLSLSFTGDFIENFQS